MYSFFGDAVFYSCYTVLYSRRLVTAYCYLYQAANIAKNHAGRYAPTAEGAEQGASQNALVKAAPDNLYNPCLLVLGHFIIAGQAESASEQVGANIGDTAGYVGVRFRTG